MDPMKTRCNPSDETESSSHSSFITDEACVASRDLKKKKNTRRNRITDKFKESNSGHAKWSNTNNGGFG